MVAGQKSKHQRGSRNEGKVRKERSRRETVEMNHRCLQTVDEPSLTAGWESDLCQCVDDLLQRYNGLETTLVEGKVGSEASTRTPRTT